MISIVASALGYVLLAFISVGFLYGIAFGIFSHFVEVLDLVKKDRVKTSEQCFRGDLDRLERRLSSSDDKFETSKRLADLTIRMYALEKQSKKGRNP